MHGEHWNTEQVGKWTEALRKEEGIQKVHLDSRNNSLNVTQKVPLKQTQTNRLNLIGSEGQSVPSQNVGQPILNCC